MTKSKLMVALALMATMAWAAVGLSQGSDTKGSGAKGSGAKQEAVGYGMAVDIEGDIFCLCTYLNMDKKVKTDCRNDNALRVQKATGKDGKEIKELGGAVLHILKGKSSEELLDKKNGGAKVKIKGMVYSDLHLIAVESFTVVTPDPGAKGSDSKGSGHK